ncbi:MAG: [NiFe]-hydrogenase assembly chaperone HybE [Xanthobacteraceae bacterium]
MPEAIRQAPIPERVQALVASFARIGEETMRGLPFYNENLVVEAIGFDRLGDDWLGALITPWFLHLMLISDQPSPYAEAANGKKRTVELPGGAVMFRCGGTDDFGLFHAHSVASPVNIYKTQEQARAAARLALARVYAPLLEESASVSQGQTGVSRRTLFRFAGRPLNSDSSS